ncbi:glycosyltransferase [Motilimonas cestriensis]|uniref:glycosyltransferase n=1 Tax=Motilimonas cestriensis TaxID=2742685 RepID=UPI003DA475C7
MKAKLYVVCSSQFGYLIDTYQYCIHLKDRYEIIYISFDEGKEPIIEDGIEIIQYKSKDRGVRKWLGFANFCAKVVKNKKAKVFVKYFRFCSFLKIKGGKNQYIMDVRTGSIDNSFISREIFNKTLWLESKFFDKRTVISDSVARLLWLSNYNVIPLGCPVFDVPNKNFDKLALLYVGTLSNRDIHKTISGLSLYIKNNPNSSHVFSYDIVGDGYNNEVEQLEQYVRDLNLEQVVKIHGRIPFNKLDPFFEKANVGVSFVPVTKHFDVQPVTKTLEYLSAGMVVIGTNTSAQKEVLNLELGVLINDSDIEFSRGISEISRKRSEINSWNQKEAVKEMTWESVSFKLHNLVLS